MKEFFENEVLDDLFEERTNGLQGEFKREYGNPKECEELERIENELENMIKDLIKDKKMQKQIFKKLEQYEECTRAESCFWNKQYYKSGFLDVISFEKGINVKKIKQSIESKNSYAFFSLHGYTFLAMGSEELDAYIAKVTYGLGKSNDDYRKIYNQIEKIKMDYKRVADFFEKGEDSELTLVEVSKAKEALSLYRKIEQYEERAILFSGCQLNYEYLKEIGMIE